MRAEGTWTSCLCLHALPNPSKAQWNHFKLKTMWLAVKPVWHAKKHELQQGHKPWKHDGHGRLIQKQLSSCATYTRCAIAAVAPAIAHSSTRTSWTLVYMDLDLKNLKTQLPPSAPSKSETGLPKHSRFHSIGPPIKMYSYTDSLQRWNKHHWS